MTSTLTLVSGIVLSVCACGAPGARANAVEPGATPASDTSECSIADDHKTARVYGALYRGSVEVTDSRILRLPAVWPPRSRSYDALRVSLQRETSDPRQETPGEFGAYRAIASFDARYLSCHITVAVFDGEVVAAAIECLWSESNGTGPCIVGRYGQLLASLGLSVGQGIAKGRVEFPDVLARMHRARRSAMGLPVDDAISPRRMVPLAPVEAAESLLSDPLARITVGEDSLAIDEARLLVDAQQLEPLRRVLRGANPEGRGLAAVGLSWLGALSPEDVIMINRLEDTYQVVTTHGCIMREWSGKEFFSDLKAHAYLFKYPRRPRLRR